MGDVSPAHSSPAASSSSPSTSEADSFSPARPTLTFYPAYCNPASPTWHTWLKLSAHDIHHVLKPRAGYTASTALSEPQGQVLFYLNHPVQLIQIIGVVVAVEPYNDRLWLFTVDDGSGETIEVVCVKPQPKPGETAGKPDLRKQKDKSEIDEDAPARNAALASLDIGTVVQAKGSITSFRAVRQLNLKRLIIVPDTAAETLLIEARTRTLAEVLCKPWVVSPERQKGLLREAQGEGEVDRKRREYLREREKRKVEREERHARRIAREYQAEEREREKAGEAVRQAGLRLQKAREGSKKS